MVLTVIQAYKKRFNQDLDRAIDALGADMKLREVCDYAMRHGGKRLRPALVHMIAEGVGNGLDVSHGAMCVEMLHVSSLLADDLPCMDDADTRNARKTAHLVYGEDVALLASYALISGAFHELAWGVEKFWLQEGVCVEKQTLIKALQIVSGSLGVDGIAGGQYLDLKGPKSCLEAIQEVIRLKTATLFDVALSLGWILGGGENDKLDIVHRLAEHMGIAFQLCDDIFDIEEDLADKSTANAFVVLGIEKASQLLQQEEARFYEVLEELGLGSSKLVGVMAALVQMVSAPLEQMASVECLVP